jgi:hypothetical protein
MLASAHMVDGHPAQIVAWMRGAPSVSAPVLRIYSNHEAILVAPQDALMKLSADRHP